MAKRPGDKEFDDTHDVYSRDDAADRSGRDNDNDNAYTSTRDAANLDAHVDEEYTHAAWQGNIKRSYDEYQHESLESIRRNRSYVDRITGNHASADDVRQGIANQALQNAVETANMVAKQSMRHSDVAASETWSRMETSDVAQGATQNELVRTMQLDDVSLKAIGAAVAAAIAESLAAKK